MRERLIFLVLARVLGFQRNFEDENERAYLGLRFGFDSARNVRKI